MKKRMLFLTAIILLMESIFVGTDYQYQKIEKKRRPRLQGRLLSGRLRRN